MTILEMMTALEASHDLTVDQEGSYYDVTVEDFEGFSSDWDEIERKITQPDLLNAFIKALDAQASYTSGRLYTTYYFDDFTIKLGYASYDI